MPRTKNTRGPWSTKKKDKAPRGIFRHPSGAWAIRYTCGMSHSHKEFVGRLKSDAIHERNKRTVRAKNEPGWCPVVERQATHAEAQAKATEMAAQITFGQYAADYLDWCQQPDASGQLRKRSWRSIKAEMSRLVPQFGSQGLGEITTAEVERFVEGLLADVS